MKYDDLVNVVDNIKGKLDDTESALISDDLLSIMSNYKGTLDTLDEKNEDIKKLQNEKEELLKVNGKLFQKIGFENEEKTQPTLDTPKKEETISISDIINEKGDLI